MVKRVSTILRLTLLSIPASRHKMESEKEISEDNSVGPGLILIPVIDSLISQLYDEAKN